MGAHGVENRAGLVGGGILNSGALTLRHTTISDNSAGLSGGGIVNQGGAVSLANVTFGGNTPNDCEACDSSSAGETGIERGPASITAGPRRPGD